MPRTESVRWSRQVQRACAKKLTTIASSTATAVAASADQPVRVRTVTELSCSTKPPNPTRLDKLQRRHSPVTPEHAKPGWNSAQLSHAHRDVIGGAARALAGVVRDE